jgi:ATP-binding cassette subfamily B protein
MPLLSPVADWYARRIDPEAAAEGPPPQELRGFFRWALAGSWGTVGLGVAANVVGGSIEVFSYYLLGRIVDLALGADRASLWSQNWGLLLGFAATMLIVRPLGLGMAWGTTSIALGPNQFSLVMSRLHRYTLGHSTTYFESDFAGRIAQKEMQTTRAMVDVVHESVNGLAYGAASVVAASFIVGAVSGWLILVVVAWIVMYGLYMRFFLPRLRALSQTRASRRANVTGQVVDTITNVTTVKLFAGTKREDRAAIDALRDFRAAALNWARTAVLFRVGLIAVAGLLPVSLLGFGLLLWQQGNATAGMVTATGAVALRLSQMSGWISWTLVGIFSNVGEVEDGMQTLSPAHGLVDADDATSLVIERPEVRLEGVTFQYGRTVGGIDNVDLVIEPGEKVGLVGPSGGGKSTTLSLLLRLHDVEAGRVLISGRDVRTVTQESLRAHIGMVTQETAMFNRSALDNILYGRPDANRDDVVAAAAKAEAHQFITTLEDYKGRTGYDAHLGERGVKLSGGQRQRIALARVLLKDAPILLLDEATSALDSEVESLIQRALTRAMEGKTVVAVAHRLSTLSHMDRIVVMDDGRIIEQGTHQSLLDLDGVYANLWNHQTGGFLNYDDPQPGRVSPTDTDRALRALR